MLFLYDVQSPINIGLTLRAAEQFQRPVTIFDPRKILDDPEKSLTVSDFSCGALTRTPPQRVDSLTSYRDNKRGRLVATCLAPDSVPLPEFTFWENDTVLLGNEYDGLPQWLIEFADIRLNIPLPPGSLPKPKSHSPIDPLRETTVSQDGTPNLNVSTAAAIISYSWRMQNLMQEMDDLSELAARKSQNRAKTG